MALMSACRPAPAPESEPAMVMATTGSAGDHHSTIPSQSLEASAWYRRVIRPA